MTSCAVHNCLYVATEYANAVHRVALSSGRGTERVTHWSVDGNGMQTYQSKLSGLYVNEASNVLVTCSATLSVKEFTTEGALLRSIDLRRTNAYPIQSCEGYVDYGNKEDYLGCQTMRKLRVN